MGIFDSLRRKKLKQILALARQQESENHWYFFPDGGLTVLKRGLRI